MMISRFHERGNTGKARVLKIYIVGLGRYIQFTAQTFSGKGYQSIRIHLHIKRQTPACPKGRNHLRRSYRPNRIRPRGSITSKLMLKAEKFPQFVIISIISLPNRPDRPLTPVITRQDSLAICSCVNRFNQPTVSRHQIKKGLCGFRPRITNLLTGDTKLFYNKGNRIII